MYLMDMNNDAIIFDVDGTLWNACPASAKGWNIGLAKLGIETRVTSAQIESVAGNPYEKCVDILLPGLKNQYPELLDILSSHEREVVKSVGGTLYDGVTHGIQTLASRYKIFLVSNCQDWYMKLFLNFSSCEPALTGFDCFGMSGLPKDQMLTRIKRNYSLNNPVYVGDTKEDESAASLANIEFIHVSYGFGSLVQKTQTFNSFIALLNYFLGTP